MPLITYHKNNMLIVIKLLIREYLGRCSKQLLTTADQVLLELVALDWPRDSIGCSKQSGISHCPMEITVNQWFLRFWRHRAPHICAFTFIIVIGKAKTVLFSEYWYIFISAHIHIGQPPNP